MYKNQIIETLSIEDTLKNELPPYPKTIYRNLVVGATLENPVHVGLTRMRFKVKPHKVWEGGVDVDARRGKKRVVAQCNNLKENSTCYIGKDRFESSCKELIVHKRAIKLWITTKPLLKYQRECCAKHNITIIELSGQVQAVTEAVIQYLIRCMYFIVDGAHRVMTMREMGRKRVKFKLLSTQKMSSIWFPIPRLLRLMQIYLRDIKIFNVEKIFPRKPLTNIYLIQHPYNYHRFEDLT